MAPESDYQRKAIGYARGMGCMAHRNYFAPGSEVGWPDAEIFMPGGRVLFIEFKVQGKALRKIQAYRIQRLRKMGHAVATCYNFEDAKRAIDELLQRE